MAHNEKHREGARHALLIEAVSNALENDEIVRNCAIFNMAPFWNFIFVYRPTKRK